MPIIVHQFALRTAPEGIRSVFPRPLPRAPSHPAEPNQIIDNRFAPAYRCGSLFRSILAIAALMACAVLCACTRTEQQPAGPPEKITIAISATTDAVLAEVAQVNGYFRQEGLEVTAHLHPYGKLALEDMLAGKADIATVAETPVMFAIMSGKKIVVIATIQSSNLGNAILARRDLGIHAIGDLGGKKIAVTIGTTTDFFLDSMLSVNGISREAVQIVGLSPREMADALARGDIDAASMFDTYAKIAQKKLGDRAISFQDMNIYRATFNVVALQDFTRQNPAKIGKVLRALIRAEAFVREHPADAQQIVADFIKTDIDNVRAIWDSTRFAVTLDQALVLALEDESRWAIKSGLTSGRSIPNYLEYLYLDGLNSIKPEAVRILR